MYPRLLVLVICTIILASVASVSAAPSFPGNWAPAASIETVGAGAHPSFNTAWLEGCPFVAPDGTTLYIASNRPGGLGGIDVWVSTRDSVDDPWGELVNVGAPVNSAANDFCPTIARDGHMFYFVSDRPGGCGAADIYVTRRHPHGWADPENLGCQVNSPANEFSPMPMHEPGIGPVLYFSSNRTGGYTDDAPNVDHDIYLSQSHGGAFGPAELVPGVNTAFEDSQPNLRHDGQELYFYSTRPGTLGLADIYVATRQKASEPWSEPVNLGPNVNSADGAETRPSLSWDGTILYFGSAMGGGEGSSDIYVTTRERFTGRD